jgi:rod shape-determining protein MreC
MRPSSARVEVAAVNPRRGFAVLVVVLAGCVLMMSAQAPARGGRGTLLRSWLLSGVAPLAAAVGSVSRGISGAIDHTAELFSARDDNERLKRELDASQRELFVLRARAQEADEARRLEVAGSALPNIVTSVPLLLVERRSGTYSAIVGAGSAQGVVPGSPLAVPAGLVGRVVTVGHGVSRAQLLLDASAAAGARIARTGELGVVRGDGRGGLYLNNIGLASTVARGDVVESAGIDGIYPRGVAIGKVEDVSRGGKLFLEIRVAPAADFSKLTDVLLLAPSPAVKESPEATAEAERRQASKDFAARQTAPPPTAARAAATADTRPATPVATPQTTLAARPLAATAAARPVFASSPTASGAEPTARPTAAATAGPRAATVAAPIAPAATPARYPTAPPPPTHAAPEPRTTPTDAPR